MMEGPPLTGLDLGSADIDPTRRALLGLGLYSAVLDIPGWPEVSQRFQRLRRLQRLQHGGRVTVVQRVTRHPCRSQR